MTGEVPPRLDCHTCPECRRPNPCATFDFTTCTPLEKLADCDSTNSQPPGTCCRTCKPPPPTCTATAMTTCATTIASLTRICASVAEFVFDTTTCCYPCKPPERPPTDPCTPERIFAALALVPDCGPTQVPVPVPGFCALSCKKPGTACDPARTTDRALVPTCPIGVTPVWDGCDPNCKYPEPVCAPTCSATEKCVRDAGALANGPRCVTVDACRLFYVGGMNTLASPTDVFRGVVDRHCMDPFKRVDDGCRHFLDRLLSSLDCKRTGITITKEGHVYVQVKCCHQRDPAVVGRRLLSSDGLFTGATNNPGATGSLTFYAEQSAAPAIALGFASLSTLFALF